MKRTHFIIDIFVRSEEHPVEILDLLYDELDLGAIESLLIDLEEHNLTCTARCEIWDEPPKDFLSNHRIYQKENIEK